MENMLFVMRGKITPGKISPEKNAYCMYCIPEKIKK